MLMINMYILAAFTLLHLVTANFLLTFIIRIGIDLMIAVDYTVGNALLTEWLPKGEDSKRQSHLLIYWTIGFILSYLAATFFKIKFSMRNLSNSASCCKIFSSYFSFSLSSIF